MSERLTFGTVCDGIGCGHLAFNQAGFRCAWSFEIEAFPSAVLAYRFPEVKNWGDMNAARWLLASGSIESPDVFIGGTPCQAFSVAGKREGLKDARGNLSLEFCRIADAIDNVRQRDGKPPCAVLWENVPGVLSDKGNAFGCFLGELSGAGCELQPPGGRWRNAGCVFGPKRTVAWRTLDSEFFGVPQRRRRVFVVAGSGAFRPEEALFEFGGLRRDSPPSREAGQGIAGCLTGGASGGRSHGKKSGTDREGFLTVAKAVRTPTGGIDREDMHTLIPAVAGALSADDCEQGHTTLQAARSSMLIPAVAGCLQERDAKGADSDTKPGHLIAVNSGQGFWRESDHAGTLGTEARAVHENNLVPVAFQPRYFTRDNKTGGAASCGPTVAALSAQHAGGDSAPCVAFHENQRAEVTCNDTVGALKCTGGKPGQGYPAAFVGMQVRRLTPIETERLQGLPDNWTLIPWRGKPAEDCPDGPRYKGVGNGQTVTVMRWLAERIKKGLGAS